MSSGATGDLFNELPPRSEQRTERLAEGAVVLRGFARDVETALMQALREVLLVAPFRHMTTPGGYRMSVAMTNCGTAGWVTDRSGYRYDRIDPTTERPWPAMPQSFRSLADRASNAAGYPGFEPDSCLMNRYDVGARLSLHQDRNERQYSAPIVSVSLGLPATFLFGGLKRSDRPLRVPLESGDVVVWGGATRLAFHGVATLAAGEHPLTGPHRINLTFRQAL
jgi:DNA oxidative demethylase